MGGNPGDAHRDILKGPGEPIFHDAVINGANDYQWYMAGGGLVDKRDSYED
jgi:hypothetical protein